MCKLVTMDVNGKKIKVADIKKEYIQNIINCIPLCNKIEKVVLFGSALETRCNESSDIDIAVFGKLPKCKMYASKDYLAFIDSIFAYDSKKKFFQDYDILYFNSDKLPNSQILSNIAEGEVLFEGGLS